jgi:hypothetical protein
MVLLRVGCVGCFDVGEASVQVDDGGRLGEPGVAGRDRLRDGGMLGGCGSEPAGIVGGKPADPDQVNAQAAHGLGQVGVGDGGVDCCVQPAHQFVVVMQGRLVTANQCGSLEQFALQALERRSLAAPRSQCRRPALKGFAEFEQFVNVLKRDVGDDDAAAACRREAFRRKAAQGFPQRCARDAQTLGLFHLGKDRTRRQAPFDDVIAQGGIGLVAGAHARLLPRLTASVYTQLGSKEWTFEKICQKLTSLYTATLVVVNSAS